MTRPNDPTDAPAVLTLDALRPTRGGLQVSTGLRAGEITQTVTVNKAKTADKNFQAVNAFVRG